MSNLPDLKALKLRAIAVCQEALPTTDGKPFLFHTQDILPYFVAYTGTIDFEKDGLDIDQCEITLTLRHVVANLTEGLFSEGEAEERRDEQSLAVINTLRRRELLQSAAYPDPLDFLEEARFVRASMQTWTPQGEGAGRKLGVDYTLACVCRVDNEQDYE